MQNPPQIPLRLPSASVAGAHMMQEAQNAPGHHPGHATTRPAFAPQGTAQSHPPTSGHMELLPLGTSPTVPPSPATSLSPEPNPGPQQQDGEGGGTATISLRCLLPAQPPAATSLDKASRPRGVWPRPRTPAAARPISPRPPHGVSPPHPAWGKCRGQGPPAQGHLALARRGGESLSAGWRPPLTAC